MLIRRGSAVKRVWWVIALAIGINGSAAAGEGTPAAAPAPDLRDSGFYVSSDRIYDSTPNGPFETGDSGEVSVVGMEQTDADGAWLVVVRNNSGEAVNDIEITGTLMENNEAVALGVSTFVRPNILEPNALGFLFLELEGDILRSLRSTEPDVTVSRADLITGTPYYTLRIASTIITRDEVVVAISAEDYAYADGVSIITMCFAEGSSGRLRVNSWFSENVELDQQLRRGASDTITADAPENCGDLYLVAVTGY